MKELVTEIAKALVDHPEQVQVNSIEGEQVILFAACAATILIPTSTTAQTPAEISPTFS